MSNELVVKKDELKQYDLSIIEQVVMTGDLSKLNSEQRVTYYHKVCESIGLNPMTKPFAYISLNGTLQLYAKKDATEQLRSVRGISIVSLHGKVVDDLYIVHAKATMPCGRVDESTGAVSFANLKGEAKANAIMKAETKAKRRVTLSISGLGFVDDSEVDSIPYAKRVEVDMNTGEIKGEIKDKQQLSLNHSPAPTAPPHSPQIPVEPLIPIDPKFKEEFMKKHELFENQDKTISRKLQYVRYNATTFDKPEEYIIERACRKPEDFQNKFNDWQKKNFKNPVIEPDPDYPGMSVFE